MRDANVVQMKTNAINFYFLKKYTVIVEIDSK